LKHQLDEMSHKKLSYVHELFLVLLGSVETQLKWSQVFCISLAEYSFVFEMVQKLQILIKKPKTSRQKQSGTFFLAQGVEAVCGSTVKIQI